MGITIILVFIGIVLLIQLPVLKVDKEQLKIKPTFLSLITAMLLVLNWTLYLTEFYARLPHNIAESIFLPIWFALCVLGFVTAFREFWNNRILAIVIGGLSSITSLIGLLLFGIGRM